MVNIKFKKENLITINDFQKILFKLIKHNIIWININYSRFKPNTSCKLLILNSKVSYVI